MEVREKEENWIRILGPEVISSLGFLFASYIPLDIKEANKLEMPIGTDKKSTTMTTKAYSPS